VALVLSAHVRNVWNATGEDERDLSCETGEESEGSARLRGQTGKAQDEAHFRRCRIEWLPVVALLGGSGDEARLAAPFRSVDDERMSIRAARHVSDDVIYNYNQSISKKL